MSKEVDVTFASFGTNSFGGTKAIPPEDSLLDSTVSPSTPHACMEMEIDFSLLAKGDNVDSQYYKHLGLTVSAAGGWNGSSATSL
jgi:hypothetical protein